MNYECVAPTGASGQPFLVGKRVRLRPLREADAEGAYPSWFNDPEVCKGNSHHVFPYTPEAAREFIRRVSSARDELVLAIELRESGLHVGNLALQGIHPVARSAEFAIIIGERSVWGNGIGREAAFLICEHGFRELNLHRISCATFEDNKGMVALAGSLGMVKEGCRREAIFKNGRWLNVVEFGVLRHEFEVAANRMPSNERGE